MGVAENIREIKQELPEGITLVAVSKFHPFIPAAAKTQSLRLEFENKPQNLRVNKRMFIFAVQS